MSTQSESSETPSGIPLAPVQLGSRIDHAPTVRKIRVLLIYEQELDQVGLLNSLASWLFSAASGCFLFVGGLRTNAAMQDKLSQKGVALLQFGVPARVVIGIGFSLAGVWAWRSKRSRLEEIKSQAVDIDQSASIALPREAEIAHLSEDG